MNKEKYEKEIDEEFCFYDPEYKENPTDFPANLVEDIFGPFYNHYEPEDVVLEVKEYFKTDSDVRKTINEILAMLEKKEEKIIRDVFEKGKSLSEIAKEQNKDIKKIDDLRETARMHLVNPSKSKYLQVYFDVFNKKNGITY